MPSAGVFCVRDFFRWTARAKNFPLAPKCLLRARLRGILTCKNMKTLFIDLGSNSIKSLLADFESGRLRPLADSTLPNRISSGGALVADAAETIVRSVSELMERARAEAGSFDTVCFGTSALRDSPNAPEALARAEAMGVKIRVLSGAEEAELSFAGAAGDPSLGLGPGESVVYGDIGGGSMEFVCRQGAEIFSMKSLPLGAVRLAKMFSSGGVWDAPALRAHCRGLLAEVPAPEGPFKMAVSGGAVTAARHILGGGVMAESPDVDAGGLEFAFEVSLGLSPEGLSEKYGIPENRADILPAAFACLLEVLARFGRPSFRHSQRSLRYGAAEMYFKNMLSLEKI